MAQSSGQTVTTYSESAERGSFGTLALALFLSLAIISMMCRTCLGFMGGALLLVGLIGAGVLWLKGDTRAQRWDVPALLVFLGFAACILSGPASRILS